MCEIQYMQKNPAKLRIYRRRIHTCLKSARFGIFQTRRSKISLLLCTDVLEIRLCLYPLTGHCVIKMHCCLQVGNFTNLHIEPNMELDCLNVYGQAMIPHASDFHFFKILVENIYTAFICISRSVLYCVNLPVIVG